MIEPISSAFTGVRIVANLLSVCFAGYQLLSSVSAVGEESQVLLCRLQIEETRLRLWAQDTDKNIDGSSGNSSLDRRLEELGIRNIVLLILAHMAGTLSNAKRLRSKYGILCRSDHNKASATAPPTPELPNSVVAAAAASLRSDDQVALEEHENAIHKYAERMQNTLSFLRKMQFVLNDKHKFTNLLDQLRYFNEALVNLTTPSRRAALSLALSAKMLDDTVSDDQLIAIKVASETSYEPLSSSATLKRLRLQIQHPTNNHNSSQNNITYLSATDIRCKWALLHLNDPNAYRSLGWYGEQGDRKLVIAEWKDYDRSLPREDTVDRIQDIARYLHASSLCRSPDLPVLECLGYVEDIKQRRCCFLYVLPASLTSSPDNGQPTAMVEVKTLAELIPAEFTRAAVPSLEDRFQLAQVLAVAIFRIHLTGWLHKGIRSSNIVFLAQAGQGHNPALVRMPVLMGFDYSRPDRPSAVSDPVTPERTLFDWDLNMHPDYQVLSSIGQDSRPSDDVKIRVDRRYKRLFDIYSLGLVLLEIALWEPLATFRKKKHSPADFKTAVLKIAEEEVGGAMGKRYRDVVIACISGEPFTDEEEGKTDQFLVTVVNELYACSL